MMKIINNKSIKENMNKRNIFKRLKNMTIMALEQLDYQERGARGTSWLWSNWTIGQH
jgi:hypothetical protein